MTTPPAEVSHLRVYLTGFSLVTADGADADNLPDWEGADGTVTITPQLAANSVVITSGGRGFIPMEKSFPLTAGNFEAWVLNPSDPDLNPSGWTYKVTVTVTTPSRAVIAGTLAPQVGDTDINLLPLLPLSSSTGGLITIPPGLTESQLLALDADDESSLRVQQDERHMSMYVAQPAALDPAGLVPKSDGAGSYSWQVETGGGATLAISEDGTGGLVLSSDTALTDDGSGGVTITI